MALGDYRVNSSQWNNLNPSYQNMSSQGGYGTGVNQGNQWFSNPVQNIPGPTSVPTGPTQQTKGTLGAIVQSLGKYLSPQEAFSNQLSYDQYAAPQREVFNQWEQQMYRPEFERQTLNPWNEQYANQAAAGTTRQMGGAPQAYQRANYEVQQPYYNQLEQARQQYEQMMREGYNTRMQRNYESPNAFTNIGNTN